MNSRSGTTAACLTDYLSKIEWGSKKTTEQCMPIAEFAGVGQPSIRRWHADRILPVGLELVKLRYFLEQQGYQVAELEALNSHVRILGKLIVYGALDLQVAVDRLKFPDKSKMFRLLHGGCFTSPERSEVIATICQENSQNPLVAAIGRQEVAIPELAPPQSLPSAQVSHAEDALTEDEKTIRLLQSLNGLVTVLSQNLEKMLSEGYTAGQRHAFREKAGRALIFDQSNLLHTFNQQLNGLCSETARRDLMSAKK